MSKNITDAFEIPTDEEYYQVFWRYEFKNGVYENPIGNSSSQ